MLKNLISSSGNLYKLLSNTGSVPISVFGVGRNEQILIIDEFNGTKLIVASSDDEAVNIYDILINENKNATLLNTNLETSISNFSSSVTINYLKVLQDIATKDVDYVVISPKIVLDKLPNLDYIKSLILNIKVGKNYNISDIVKRLVRMGYIKTDVVQESLQFSVKGDILTIFPINFEYPVRLSFFDDLLEFAKLFNPNDQSIIDELENLNIYSTTFLSSTSLDIVSKNTKTRQAEENLNDIISSVNIEIQNGVLPVWAKVFDSQFKYSIFDILDDGLAVFDSPKLILNNITTALKEIKEDFDEKLTSGLVTHKHKEFYNNSDTIFDFSSTKCGLLSFQNINTANNIFKPHMVFSIPTTPQLNYNYNRSTLYDDVSRQIMLGYTVVIFAGSDDLLQKLEKSFLPKNVVVNKISTFTQVQKNCVNIITKSSTLSGSFDEDKITFIGLNNGKVKKHNHKDYSTDVFLPQIGDYVVHNTYGIGKCVGITKLSVNNAQKDYIEIEYKNSDKLFLPVENIDFISKYIGVDKPKLNKLGSTEFLKTKQKVREGLRQLTIDLKKLYAKRNMIKGIEFPKDDDIQLEFERSCSFQLTDDQDKAINDVKKDMESSHVMDRLICGDVGYGKTEVALRATFKAVMAGYQVMMLCPTTILSVQHFNTFQSRLKDFGVNLELLNRFKSIKETNEIIEKFKNGEIEVLIGTHKLLSDKVTPKNLGLLILDEEQRFGVEHKEKIKNLKNNIDVLTMSATPIPRTLHSALIGVKDVSVIETPPFGRLPVITTVSEQNDTVIHNAIMRELGRDGQVLIIYNRVETILEFKKHIKDMVGDDVSIDVAHGQMDENSLEKAILRLYNGDTKILISTTLIENGIDLPRANTLIIVNADMLGLSQLYQLKGRIGRSNRQGYAIFMYDKNKILSEDAYKRLGAIVEYSGLGNGYKIAMRDLEIRGAGSLFGAEQSGHIESVGYSMYLSLISEALSDAKGKPISMDKNDIKIDCFFDAMLPNYYVENTSSRIEIYSEIAKIKDESMLQDYVNKLKFDFGEVPSELINLIYVAMIKNNTYGLDIRRISIQRKETTIYFDKACEKLLESLSLLMTNNKFNLVLNLEKLPIITLVNSNNNYASIKNILELLKVLRELLNK